MGEGINMTTAEKLVKVLAEKKLTCATAESCTGGGVGYAITSVSGASAVFWGGVISYDNSVKHGSLGVPVEILKTKGAVSPEWRNLLHRPILRSRSRLAESPHMSYKDRDHTDRRLRL